MRRRDVGSQLPTARANARNNCKTVLMTGVSKRLRSSDERVVDEINPERDMLLEQPRFTVL